MTLPQLTFSTPAEPFITGNVAQKCDPTPRAGVVFFRDLIRQNVGGGDLGIATCNRPYVSDHFEGRAWDWRVFAHVPNENAMAEEVIAWLLENDWEIFRRLGLKYVIWNRERYEAGHVNPYTGDNPHVDHVHFSFGWPGALGRTSFFPAAGFTAPDNYPSYVSTPATPKPIPGQPPAVTAPPIANASPTTVARVVAALAGATAAYLVVRAFA